MRGLKWFLYGWLAVALLAFGMNSCKADIISEIGMGYKIPYTTSVVMLPGCHTVEYQERTVSCGGDNPAFIGWPLAWESDNIGYQGRFRVRAGWFHYSNWFDGQKQRETHMDLIAVTVTIRWSE